MHYPPCASLQTSPRSDFLLSRFFLLPGACLPDACLVTCPEQAVQTFCAASCVHFRIRFLCCPLHLIQQASHCFFCVRVFCAGACACANRAVIGFNLSRDLVQIATLVRCTLMAAVGCSAGKFKRLTFRKGGEQCQSGVCKLPVTDLNSPYRDVCTSRAPERPHVTHDDCGWLSGVKWLSHMPVKLLRS